MTALALALSAATALTALTSPADAAVKATQIQPGTLDRGAAGKVPHVQGSDLVVGTHRYTFQGRDVRYLGISGDEYVVGTWVQGRPASQRAVRVTQDDHRTTIIEGPEPSELVLSSDGEQLFHVDYNFHAKTSRVVGWSVDTGNLVATKTFRKYVDVLDSQGLRVLLSSYGQHRTFWWNQTNGRTRTVTQRIAYRGDIASNRLASVTGDPYQAGCSVVSSINHPEVAKWRSCDQAVVTFSPDGHRMATDYLLADGLGPGEVQLRRVDGKLLGKWDTYFFSGIDFEDDNTLLMLASGKKKTAWVRCTVDDCERTSRLTRTPV